uniref:Uncharacterized protein n=1 Tax=Loigolactobacillus rennini TaxID=238013 RepID=A0A1K2I3R7_9LACO|nr:hypothetical protein LREN565_0153 [Loigolactobacillus rennini]
MLLFTTKKGTFDELIKAKGKFYKLYYNRNLSIGEKEVLL